MTFEPYMIPLASLAADALVAVLGADEEDARDAAALRRLCAAV